MVLGRTKITVSMDDGNLKALDIFVSNLRIAHGKRAADRSEVINKAIKRIRTNGDLVKEAYKWFGINK